MDPDEALRIILKDVARGDYRALRLSCFNLAQWLEKGGFVPQNAELLADTARLLAFNAFRTAVAELKWIKRAASINQQHLPPTNEESMATVWN